MKPLLERLQAAVDDRYRVEREIGRGGMSTVFLGEDLKHHRRVAIKVLDPELSSVLGPDRFAREIELAARLQHPHILTLLDSGAGEGLLYYVMPFVEGESLRARLEHEKRLGVDETVRLGIEAARALDYAHRQGIVHRDIKPENVLLADGQAIIADFGIARAIRAAGGEQLTTTGLQIGTPAYMSPEQVTAERELDGRSDVYSLGCILYELLAGQPPFSGPRETLGHQHLNVAARPVTELRPGTPPALAAAIDRSLAKTPADRFATAGQFADALGATKATAPSAVRRRFGWAAVLVALILATVVGWQRGVFQSLLPHRTAETGERQWVWLAAFEGPSDDPSLAPAARDMIGSALDESGLLASVPLEQIRIALRNAGRPETTRVDVELARQLAYRSSIRVVVTGQVARIGGGYTVGVRAIDAESGRVLIAPTGSAADERALIPALTRLARELRRGLGERPEALRVRSPVFDAPTPSFEAFKLYAKGRAAINDARVEDAIPLLRRAVALDPAFAAAWSALGTAFSNSGRRDSALVAHRQALRHPDRLTEARRLDVLAKVASLEGREAEAMGHYDAMLALDPPPVDRAVALNNKALRLEILGRYEEALELFRLSAKTWPVESPQISQVNIAGALMALGKPEEARTVAPRLRGPSAAGLEVELAFTDRAWARGESLGVAAASAPGAPVFTRLIGTLARASALSARGETRKGRAVMLEAENIAAGVGLPSGGVGWLNRAWIDLFSGREPPTLPASFLTGELDAARALRAAMVGDSIAARRSLAAFLVSAPEPTRAVAVEQVEGWLDYRRGRWREVIEGLAAHARTGLYDPGSTNESLRIGSRWIVADAFLHSRQPDSAVVYLGLMLEPPGHAPHVVIARGFYEPQVRARLVQVFAGMGRMDDARSHWEILSETVTRPDPEMLAMLDETRAVLQTAQAMRASDRR